MSVPNNVRSDIFKKEDWFCYIGDAHCETCIEICRVYSMCIQFCLVFCAFPSIGIKFIYKLSSSQVIFTFMLCLWIGSPRIFLTSIMNKGSKKISVLVFLLMKSLGQTVKNIKKNRNLLLWQKAVVDSKLLYSVISTMFQLWNWFIKSHLSFSNSSHTRIFYCSQFKQYKLQAFNFLNLVIVTKNKIKKWKHIRIRRIR